jgi:N-acetylmuramoyl-L-alanine amidase
MGFLSNSDDEGFLRDVQKRARLMNAVGDSIDDYFAQATRIASR